MNTIVMDAADVGKVWRGARGSGDMIQGKGALVIRNGDTEVQIVGTREGLEALKDRIVDAMEAEAW